MYENVLTFKQAKNIETIEKTLKATVLKKN